MLPWSHWFHCMGSTYGTWLRGDPRGWRARHHREHVDGDYKNPPPAGTYDRLFAQSKRSMRRDEVLLDWQQRVVACREMGKTLLYHKVELIDLSVGAAHFHLLARFTPLGQSPGIRIPGCGGKDPTSVNQYELLKRRARHFVGIAKKNSARALSDAGLAAPGGSGADQTYSRPRTSTQRGPVHPRSWQRRCRRLVGSAPRPVTLRWSDPASRGLIMSALWRKMTGPSAKAGSFLAACREQ